MISKLGPLFRDHGVAMLETACHNIASWYGTSFWCSVILTDASDAKERQSPSPGSTVELGFLGSVLHVELPLGSDSQQPAETGTFDERFNPAVHVSTPNYYLHLLTDPMCSSLRPPHRWTRHQYSSSKRRWQTYGRCGNA